MVDGCEGLRDAVNDAATPTARDEGLERHAEAKAEPTRSSGHIHPNAPMAAVRLRPHMAAMQEMSTSGELPLKPLLPVEAGWHTVLNRSSLSLSLCESCDV